MADLKYAAELAARRGLCKDQISKELSATIHHAVMAIRYISKDMSEAAMLEIQEVDLHNHNAANWREKLERIDSGV